MCLFISVFVERYGPRVMIMITNLCATAGIILSSFAPNAAVLFITYGIIPGMKINVRQIVFIALARQNVRCTTHFIVRQFGYLRDIIISMCLSTHFVWRWKSPGLDILKILWTCHFGVKNKISERQLLESPNHFKILFHCISFVGFGFGTIMVCIPVVLSQYFTKLRPFALGIAICGLSVGNIIFPPFTRYLLETYGWRGTLLLLGGVSLHLVPLAAVFKPPANLHQSPQNTTNINFTSFLKKAMDFSLLKDNRLKLFIVGTTLGNMGIMTFLQHTPSAAVSWGLPLTQAALLPAAFAIPSIILWIPISAVASMQCTNR